ncbi:hypothetical protein ACOMHN_008890 [Nucella lapillus]
MLSVWCRFVTLVFLLLGVSVSTADDEERKAWACFGNFHNFLGINCPQDRQVELVSMMNGAKHSSQNCPPVTTDLENFRADCCSFAHGDCVIRTHPNNFPVECSTRPFCRPQSRLADTGPQCNSNDFPKFTHYTEITYRCIVPPITTPTTRSTTKRESTTGRKSTPNTNSSSNSSFGTTTTDSSTPLTQKNVTDSSTPLTQKNVDDESDNFTPAMIGGMLAGIVGLILTIFIFMFYWGRKRHIRISGKNQSNMWDFLLSNTMSVRAFRGYDNFSSSRYSQGSEEGSPGVRKTMWLPNISLDSGQGHSNVTSDDNCSVVTVERHSAVHAAAVGSRSPAAAPAAAARTTSTPTTFAASTAGESSADRGRRVVSARVDTVNGTAFATVAGFSGVVAPEDFSVGGEGGESTLENVKRSSSSPEMGAEFTNPAINNL